MVSVSEFRQASRGTRRLFRPRTYSEKSTGVKPEIVSDRHVPVWDLACERES